MRNLTSALFICILLPLQLLSQSHISGTITDKQTKLTVNYASVYINGTTKGTLTDSLGSFHLNNVRFPCTLVVSHLSYKTQTMELTSSTTSPLNIGLVLTTNEISGVSVQDRSLREINLTTFKKMFLGTDEWGRYARIENEDMIQFSRDYVQKTEVDVYDPKIAYSTFLSTSPENNWSEDSTKVTYLEPVNLKAKSLQPLIINLPVLGYTLYYDLLEFKAEYVKDVGVMTSMLGHYYFKPAPFYSKEDSVLITKNRMKVYYNSQQHFCKSLYEKKLAQNGYKLEEYEPKKKDEKSAIKKVSKEEKLDSCIQVQGDNALVIGLKDKKFLIRYHKRLNNTPKDLTRDKGILGIYSEVTFNKDTCLIRKDGTLPYNSITFGATIGSKKIGSLLPADYVPVH